MKYKKLLGLIIFIVVVVGCTKTSPTYLGKRTEELSIDDSEKILEESYFLPIGTVVILGESEKVMIIGILSANYDADDQGYLFKGTYISERKDEKIDKTYLFDAGAINRIVHLGFVSSDHLVKEGALVKAQLTLNGEPVFQEGYVGLKGYRYEPLSKAESNAIKKEMKYLPMGTVIKLSDVKDVITIIGYYFVSDAPRSEEFYYKIVVGTTGSGNDEDIQAITSENLLKGDILKLGYMGEEYYQIVEEIEKSAADNKAELENPSSTPKEELVRDNPVKLNLTQEGILTELEIYHEVGQGLTDFGNGVAGFFGF